MAGLRARGRAGVDPDGAPLYAYKACMHSYRLRPLAEGAADLSAAVASRFIECRDGLLIAPVRSA